MQLPSVEINRVRIEILNWLSYKSDCLKSKEKEKDRQIYMGKKRAYSAKPSITSGDRSRASLPGLALLLGMGAGGGPWGLQATGLMPAALGQTPQKPPGQIPCQHPHLNMMMDCVYQIEAQKGRICTIPILVCIRNYLPYIRIQAIWNTRPNSEAVTDDSSILEYIQ